MLDSCTKFEDYIDAAVKNGMRAIAITEHGKPLGWVYKKMYCDSHNIKFIHGVEIYLTETLENRVRDNYHTILLAKNWDGVLELNKLITLSCTPDHLYYTNRITFDEFLAISDNIISISACLASPLNKLPRDHPRYMDLARKYDFFEIQAHKHPNQIKYNQELYSLATALGKPLIAGTDTHSISKYKAECRSILMKAKHKSYGDEDAFDLVFKTYDELKDAFREQDAILESIYIQAIENTNQLYDLVEDFELDRSIKYPILYGSREADSEKFSETIERKFREKIDSGIIPHEQITAFRSAIDEELRVFRKLQMDGFMLSMSELISWCKEQGYAIGTARGSVGGSRIAYVTDIIDLNPETWHTVFSRFCNEDRTEIGDIDIDCVESDRPAIFQHIINRFGKRKTARVASFGTIQDKGVVDEVVRAFQFIWNDENLLDEKSLKTEISVAKDRGVPDSVIEPLKRELKRRRDFNKEKAKENPWTIAFSKEVKKALDSNPTAAKRKYADVLYYFDGLLDVKISQSVHPAGIVISPITLDDNYGVFDKDDDNCLMIDMEELHEVGAAKYDFLVLKTVQVIRDTCRYLGREYPKTHEIDWNDELVWEDMIRRPGAIFQFEGAFAFESLRRFKPQSIFDMSLVTACIRPSGASYRNDLLEHKSHHNPSEIIDELLKDNNGYLVYQEDVIKFLQQICGMSGSEADNTRRAIGRKDEERLKKALPHILEGYCNSSPQSREVAEREAKEFLQIIEDASSYMFGYNHSIAYCLLGYICAYFRYYHPLAFIAAFLNNAANDDDIANGTELAREYGIKIVAPRFRHAKSEYIPNFDNNTVSKGMSSIKFMSGDAANALYDLRGNQYKNFAWLLRDIANSSIVDSRQLDILMKVDFFSEFGNISELSRIVDVFDFFKGGAANTIKREKIDGTWKEECIKPYVSCTGANGNKLKSYKILDGMGAIDACSAKILRAGLQDISFRVKIENQKEYLGYIDIATETEEDRRKLLVLDDPRPLISQRTGKPWAYAINARSLGSGKQERLTVKASLFNRDPIRKMDLLYAPNRGDITKNQRGFWDLNHYTKIIS